jgi:hypothetical protein
LSWNKQPTDSGSRQGVTPESFDVARAMSLLYGNYDSDKRISVISFSDQDPVRTRGEPMIVRPLFHSFGSDGGRRIFVLLTYAVPQNDEQYYCHSCAPTIGMAVFCQSGAKWVITASNRAVTSAGEFGKPPADIELVQIGANRQGVKIIDIGKGNGENTSVLQLLTPWNSTVRVALERIIADDNKGMCDGEAGPPCYANHRTIAFRPEANGDYFELQLRLDGTDLQRSDDRDKSGVRRVHGVEILRFDQGEYKQISREGDLTAIDYVVAKREGLK